MRKKTLFDGFKRRIVEWLSPTPAFDDTFKQSVKRQRHVVTLVKKTKCPNCNEKLRLVGYENSYDLTHYEAAICCDNCKGRFVFTKKGLKGDYIKQ
jgi:uncharacterized protein with PIN domain